MLLVRIIMLLFGNQVKLIYYLVFFNGTLSYCLCSNFYNYKYKLLTIAIKGQKLEVMPITEGEVLTCI